MILAYAAIFGLVQIVCTWLGTQKLFTYLKARDERERTERASLLNRIQAPEQALAAELTPDEGELVYALPFDDDEAYWKKRENQ